ncbi:hypothetical protein HYQ46_008143 [Verticillium longisporum]|nr:hypothetical protein HYQ46_008143 [Verticillium longisporum]
MCIQIYTLHISCDHHQYQNTFPCRSARGHNLGHPTRDLTLHHTKHLPASPPSESQLAMCTGELRNATRPVEGTCQACVRKAREKRGWHSGAVRMAPEQWDLEGKISSDPEGFIGAVEAPSSVVVPREGNAVKDGNGTQQIYKRSVMAGG